MVYERSGLIGSIGHDIVHGQCYRDDIFNIHQPIQFDRYGLHGLLRYLQFQIAPIAIYMLCHLMAFVFLFLCQDDV